MLDIFCKIVLDTLIDNGFTYPKDDFISIRDTLIPLLPPRNDIEWTFETLTPLIQHLHLHGYVDYYETTHGYYPVKDCYMLYTTYKGTHYKKFKWKALESFLTKSIIVPIAIAFVTALITLWLGIK